MLDECKSEAELVVHQAMTIANLAQRIERVVNKNDVAHARVKCNELLPIIDELRECVKALRDVTWD